MNSHTDFYNENTELFIDLVKVMKSIQSITNKYPSAEATRAVPILTLLFLSKHDEKNAEKHLLDCALKIRKSAVQIYTLFLGILIRKIDEFVDNYDFDEIQKAFPNFYGEKHDHTINEIVEFLEQKPTPSKDNVKQLLEYSASCKLIYSEFRLSKKRLIKVKEENKKAKSDESSQWTKRAIVTKVLLPIVLAALFTLFAYMKGWFSELALF